ncbi:Alpha/Beta hydrolase protein [Aspergillus caelatus]|uniref:Alpha/Beta hydrolase protein n=1 Tax=Aspergillus caelatus TaxID=61420 RepID=A0A5N6ZPU1_9EURO|nr:Alpha/Beta hydrolase protein [Aspergillus caelatus]KAE8359388.1 Alpha/Beta hydrolase protein [Aspergillus caelatus]
MTSDTHGSQSGSMFSIGTHSLFLSIGGVARKTGEPLVIFLAGAGDVASSYVAVERLVGTFAPVVLYDRSGLGRSQGGPTKPTATAAATELHQLLHSADLTPPLLLVAHSYGGIVAREYLHLYPEEVAGMVLADASTERQAELLDDPDLDINAVLGDLKFSQVTGLRDSARLSRDEWRARAADIARGIPTSQAETAAAIEVCKTLGSKEQYRNQALGVRPLSVIRCHGSQDYRRIYEKGVGAGNGTEAQRAAFRRLLDRWDHYDQRAQGEQLRLSSNSRLTYLPDCGHHIHLIRPDVVAFEIQWVRDQILEKSNLPWRSNWSDGDSKISD